MLSINSFNPWFCFYTSRKLQKTFGVFRRYRNEMLGLIWIINSCFRCWLWTYTNIYNETFCKHNYFTKFHHNGLAESKTPHIFTCLHNTKLVYTLFYEQLHFFYFQLESLTVPWIFSLKVVWQLLTQFTFSSRLLYSCLYLIYLWCIYLHK